MLTWERESRLLAGVACAPHGAVDNLEEVMKERRKIKGVAAGERLDAWGDAASSVLALYLVPFGFVWSELVGETAIMNMYLIS